MQKGDLVRVRQELGAGAQEDRQFRDRGLGVVLEVKDGTFFRYGLETIPLGKTARVALTCGQVEAFHESSVEVVNEGR